MFKSTVKTKALKEEINSLIFQGKIEDALKIILTAIEINSKEKFRISMIAGRLADLNLERSQVGMPFIDYTTSRNKITRSLIEQLEKLFDQNEPKGANNNNKYRNFSFYKILFFTSLVFLIGLSYIIKEEMNQISKAGDYYDNGEFYLAFEELHDIFLLRSFEPFSDTCKFILMGDKYYKEEKYGEAFLNYGKAGKKGIKFRRDFIDNFEKHLKDYTPKEHDKSRKTIKLR